MEVMLSKELFFFLGDSIKFGADLVQSSLKRAVVDGHGLNSVSVELSSGTWAGEDLPTDGFCDCRDKVV